MYTRIATTKMAIIPIGGGPNLTGPTLIPYQFIMAYPIYPMHFRLDLYGVDVERF